MERRAFREFDPEEFGDVVYHYTTASGLLGILRTQSLWATDAEFLNDAQEMTFGRDEMVRALLGEAEALSPSTDGGLRAARDDKHEDADNRASILRSAASELAKRSGLDASSNQHRLSAYVACFCESGDLLSQWRGYAAGAGFAIGFSRRTLRETTVRGSDSRRLNQLHVPQLKQVEYGVDAIGPAVQRAVSEIAPVPTGHPGVKGFVRAVTVALPVLARLKHEAFAEEREWRLVMVDPDHSCVSYREGVISPTPYIALTLPADAVALVVVGPGEHAGLRCEGVRRLAESSGIPDMPVRLSRAPFRA